MKNNKKKIKKVNKTEMKKVKGGATAVPKFRPGKGLKDAVAK